MNMTAKQYAQTWHELLTKTDKSRWHEASKKILALIYKNGHLSRLNEIVNHIEYLLEKSSGQERVEVTSARKLDNQFIKKIVSQVIGHDKTEIIYKENPDLLSGLTIATKNKRWNLSLRAKLDALKKQLIS